MCDYANLVLLFFVIVNSLLTLSKPFIVVTSRLMTVPFALRCNGGEGRGLGFSRSLDTRSTLIEVGNLYFVLFAGDELE